MSDLIDRRPWIIAVLALLWFAGLLLFPVLAWSAYTKTGIGAGAVFLTGALISALMTYGLWTAQKWARLSQVLLLLPIVVFIPVGPAAIITIGYMNRAETRSYFALSPGAPTWGSRTFLQSEWPWILSIVLTLGLGVALFVSMGPLFRQWD